MSLGKHATVFQAEVYAMLPVFMKLKLRTGQTNALQAAKRLLWYESARTR